MRAASLGCQRAWALAAAHGHWWSGRLEFLGVDLFDPKELEAAAVAAWAAEVAEAAEFGGRPWGGVVPHLEDGCLVHATASGRLAWTIRPDGAVSLEVHRPNGRCLEAFVPPHRRVRSVGIDAGPRPAMGRHVECLAEALTALGLPCPGAGDAIFADEQGVTPAVREVRELTLAAYL